MKYVILSAATRTLFRRVSGIPELTPGVARQGSIHCTVRAETWCLTQNVKSDVIVVVVVVVAGAREAFGLASVFYSCFVHSKVSLPFTVTWSDHCPNSTSVLIPGLYRI